MRSQSPPEVAAYWRKKGHQSHFPPSGTRPSRRKPPAEQPAEEVQPWFPTPWDCDPGDQRQLDFLSAWWRKDPTFKSARPEWKPERNKEVHKYIPYLGDMPNVMEPIGPWPWKYDLGDQEQVDFIIALLEKGINVFTQKLPRRYRGERAVSLLETCDREQQSWRYWDPPPKPARKSKPITIDSSDSSYREQPKYSPPKSEWNPEPTNTDSSDSSADEQLMTWPQVHHSSAKRSRPKITLQRRDKGFAKDGLVNHAALGWPKVEDDPAVKEALSYNKKIAKDQSVFRLFRLVKGTYIHDYDPSRLSGTHFRTFLPNKDRCFSGETSFLDYLPMILQVAKERNHPYSRTAQALVSGELLTGEASTKWAETRRELSARQDPLSMQPQDDSHATSFCRLEMVILRYLHTFETEITSEDLKRYVDTLRLDPPRPEGIKPLFTSIALMVIRVCQMLDEPEQAYPEWRYVIWHILRVVQATDPVLGDHFRVMFNQVVMGYLPPCEPPPQEKNYPDVFQACTAYRQWLVDVVDYMAKQDGPETWSSREDFEEETGQDFNGRNKE